MLYLLGEVGLEGCKCENHPESRSHVATPRAQPHRLGGIHRLNQPTTFRDLTHYLRLYTPISYLSQWDRCGLSSLWLPLDERVRINAFSSAR